MFAENTRTLQNEGYTKNISFITKQTYKTRETIEIFHKKIMLRWKKLYPKACIPVSLNMHGLYKGKNGQRNEKKRAKRNVHIQRKFAE